MSLFTRRGRIDVSTSDSDINSVASSGDQSPDELIEELARMALSGHYYGAPMAYETNEMLRGHGLARRPRTSEAAASSPPPSAGPSPPLSARRATHNGTSTPSLPIRGSSRGSGVQRRPLPKGTAGLADESERAADVSQALARMYRHLAREYATEIKREALDGPVGRVGNAPLSKSDDGDPVAGSVPATKPRQRRQTDEIARARLLSKTKVQELRQKEKYYKVKDREEEARKHPRRVRVPEKAVLLGRRLHLEAAENRRTVKEKLEELEREKEEEERKTCTFQPTISRYAERLASAGAYYTLEERLEDQAAREEDLQRLRFEHAVEQEKECTFRPTLAIGTEELVAQQRQRRSRSRRRSLSRSRRRHASTHEPFEPGERLYRDGAERLLRQQIRQKRAVARQQHRVVGGRLRLSADAAQDLADRFAAWATLRDRRQALLRDEVDRQAREGPNVGAEGGPLKRTAEGSTAVLSRSLSLKSASTARPKNSSITSAHVEDEGADRSPGHLAAPTCALPNDFLSLSVPHTPTHHIPQVGAENVVPLRRHSATPTTDLSLNNADAVTCNSSSTSSVPLDATARKEQLRIRLGALFYKYAVTPTSTTVSPAEVKHQVRCYYPEDSGVAAALVSSFDDEHQRLTKVEFMAALARYIAQSGPQPWCLPSPHNHHQSRSGSPAQQRHEVGAPASFLARLNAPTSSVSSSAKEGRPSASAPPHSSIGSAATSNTEVASRSATPAESMKSASVAARSGAGSNPKLSARALSAVVPASPTADLKPIRTHIYTRVGERVAAPPVPEEKAAVAVVLAPAGEAVKSDTLPCATVHPHASSSLYSQAPRSTNEKTTMKKPTPTSRATSPEKVPAAQLVHGYQGHVGRHRRPPDPAKAAGTDSQSFGSGGNAAADQCTFQPTLNRHSVALSHVNEERRMLYACELQLRRRELQRMRASVLEAAGSAGGAPAPSSPSLCQSVAGDGGGGRMNGAALSPQKEARSTPSRRQRSQTRSPGSGGVSPLGAGHSTSIDVSSLSSVTAQADQSGASASGVQVGEPLCLPRESAGQQAEERVSSRAPEVDVHVDATSAAASAPPHFHAKRPNNAIL